MRPTDPKGGGNISEENAELLDLDLIMWLDPKDAKGRLGGPVYPTLDVHKEGREVFLDSFKDPLGAATSFVTVLSYPYLLEKLVPRMALAVDGDLSTKVSNTTGTGADRPYWKWVGLATRWRPIPNPLRCGWRSGLGW